MLSAGCPRPLGACIVWCVFSCICVHVWPSVDFSQRLRNLAVPSLKRLTVNEPSQPNSISRFEDLKEVSPETTGLVVSHVVAVKSKLFGLVLGLRG